MSAYNDEDFFKVVVHFTCENFVRTRVRHNGLAVSKTVTARKTSAITPKTLSEIVKKNSKDTLIQEEMT